MDNLGKTLWIGGLALIGYAAFFFETSVTSTYAGRIVNLDLQQKQLMMLIVGGLATLIGVILHASYYLVIGQQKKTEEPATHKVDLATLSPEEAQKAREKALSDELAKWGA